MKNCACRIPQRPVYSRVRLARETQARLGFRMRETVAPRRIRNVEPIIMKAGPGTKCRPFLTVQKDPDRFAACNALADEIGPLNDPKKAFPLIEEAIGDEVNEVFGIVTLDLHLRMKSIAETGRGEPTSVMAPIGATLQAACADGAHAVILFHVHPSGIEAYPSDADIETTEAFEDAFEVVEIKFMDHIIIGGDARRRSYYSFLEDGALE